MANTGKRKDPRGRVLRPGEFVRASDGRYCYKFKSPDGKSRIVYATTLDELRQKEKDVQRDLLDGIDGKKAQTVTLNDLFEKRMVLKKKAAKVCDNTLLTYRAQWTYVSPTFGKIPVANLKKSDIENFYATLSDSGLSTSTIKTISMLIKECLQDCVDDDLIRKNPAAGISMDYGRPKEKRNALTALEEKNFLAFIKNNDSFSDWAPFVQIALSTGLRISELAGIVWGDIDREIGVLHVRRQLQYLCYNELGAHFEVNDLKSSNGRRDVPLTDRSIEGFSNQRKMLFQTGRRNETTVDGISDFVFITRAGNFLTEHCARYVLSRVTKLYNDSETEIARQEHREPELLPHITPHILRHTCGTRLIEAGIDPKSVSEILGHADVGFTLNHYIHPDTTYKIEQMKKMNASTI